MTHAEKIYNSVIVSTSKLKFKEAKVITPKKRIFNIIITIFLSLFTIYNYFLKEKTYIVFEYAKIPNKVVMYFLYPIIILILLTNIILTFISKSVLCKNYPRKYKAVLYFNKANKLIIATLNFVNALIIVEMDMFNSTGSSLGNSSFKEIFNIMTSNFDYLKDFGLFLVALVTFIPYFIVCFALYIVIPILIFVSPLLYLRWLFSANDIFYNYVTDPNEEGYIIKEKRRINKKFYKFTVIFKKIFFSALIVLIIIGLAFLIRSINLQE